MKNNIELFGYRIFNSSIEVTLRTIERRIRRGEKTIQASLNANKIVKSKKYEIIHRSLIEADIINADGISIILSAILVINKKIERVPGIDLMQKLIENCYKHYSFYFWGTTDENLKECVKVLRNQYQNINIVGAQSGFFGEQREKIILQEIINLQPDIIFIGMPSPLKEKLIMRIKYENVQFKLLMGVGGSFDVIGGKIKRAPLFFRKIGLEWLFRIIQEPRRLLKRYLRNSVLFTKYLSYEIIKSKFGSNDAKQ